MRKRGRSKPLPYGGDWVLSVGATIGRLSFQAVQRTQAEFFRRCCDLNCLLQWEKVPSECEADEASFPNKKQIVKPQFYVKGVTAKEHLIHHFVVPLLPLEKAFDGEASVDSHNSTLKVLPRRSREEQAPPLPS